MSRIDDLLLLEKAGQLPPEMQRDLDTLRAGGVVPPREAPTEEPAMVKQAVPTTSQRPRDFVGHLAGEITSGISGIHAGISPEQTGSAVKDFLLNMPITRGVRAGLGAAQIASSPVTAFSRSAADVTGGELTEYLAPKIGATPAAAIGTAVGTPVEFIASGGLSLLKLAPRIEQAVHAASKTIANLSGIPSAAKVASDAAQTATKWVARHLPGSVDAQINLGIEKATQVIDRLKSAAQARVVMAQTRFSPHADDPIAVPETLRRIRGMMADMKSHGVTDPNDANLSQLVRLNNVLSEKHGIVKAQWLDDELTAIGRHVGAMEGRGEYVHPGWSSVFQAMASDAENLTPIPRPQYAGLTESGFTPGPAGPLFRAKDQEIKRLKGIEEVEKIFDKLQKIKRGKDVDNPDVNANQVLNWMSPETNPKLAKSLHPDDRADLEAIFSALAELPASSPSKGVRYGAGVGLGVGALATGGAFFSGVGGGPTGAAMIGTTVTGLMTLSHALLPTRLGRKTLRAVLESGPITQTKIDLLTATVNALGEGEKVAEGVREALKSSNTPIDDKIKTITTLRGAATEY